MSGNMTQSERFVINCVRVVRECLCGLIFCLCSSVSAEGVIRNEVGKAWSQQKGEVSADEARP